MTHPTPKTGKRKKQPTAQVMREQLRLAADEIIRLRSQIAGPVTADEVFERLRNPPPPPDPPPERSVRGVLAVPVNRIPWYRRVWNRIRGRIVETDPDTAAAMEALEP